MRANQVSIFIERFGDDVPAEFDGHQRISVYADSNNLWEALWAAVAEVLDEIQQSMNLPSFGERGSMRKAEEELRRNGFID